MPAKALQSDRLEKFSSFNPAELAAIGKNYIDEFNKVQIDLFEKLQDINRQWARPHEFGGELGVKICFPNDVGAVDT